VVPAAATVLVDGNNVIGARPDGWWRDRPGAAARLLARLQCLAASGGPVVEVVFDVAPRGVDDGVHEGVHVHSATRRGRDAADDRIVELVAARGTAVEVVTSDRGLAARVRGADVVVTGAGTFLARLEEHGC
jgi:predicted RNA-binding protein with PIN domain